jgi:hypothetical protein
MSAPQDPRHPLGPREIRLLELHPGKPDDPIRCSILVASLGSNPPPQYEALSYTWGLPTVTETIIVNGFHMPILKNLHAAMRHLRYQAADDSRLEIQGAAIEKTKSGVGVEIQDPPLLRNETRGRTRIIWADAICINQADMRERENQVTLMGDIYRMCSRGVIWLGEFSDDTERAFMMAFWLCKVAYHQLPRMQHDEGDQLQRRGSSLEVYGKPSFKALIKLDNVQIKWSMCLCWKALQALVKRQWFSRAWVIQEATLASDVTVVCGYYSIPWSELVVALRCAPSIPIRPLGGLPLPSHIIVIERLRRDIAENRTALQDILLRNSGCEATEPMDRVYAFLGLVQLSELEELGLERPDYTTRDFKRLCRHAVVRIIKKSKNLNLLSGPVGNPGERIGWPSWIPDWEAKQRPRCLILDQPLFNASLSKQSPVEVLFNEDESLLGAEGFVFDHISEMSRVTDKSPPSTWTFTEYHTYKTRMEGMVEFLQQCLEWERVTSARSGEKYEGSGEPILDAYWKTLLGGHVTPENEKRQAKEFRRFDMISKDGAQVLQKLGLPAWPWIILLTPHNISRLLLRALVTRGDISGLLGRIGDFTSNPNFAFVLNRRLIRTTDGRMGLAPASTNVGDSVSLIKGASVPFIVRKRGDRWEFVGECYIHGAMFGEAWDPDPKKLKKMWFL